MGEAALVSPFEAVASTYDASFTHTRLGRLLRERVWRNLDCLFQPGDRVLELGCGTGEDAVHLARLGIHVTATDSSPAMLEEARAKATAAGVAERVRTAILDLDQPPAADTLYDGAFSDFGALNCVSRRLPLAAFLGSALRPGARLALVVMGPVCAWEILWHLAHAHPGTAFRRMLHRPGRVGDGVEVDVSYPSPRRLGTELAPWFRPVRKLGIGVFLPPTDLGPPLERHPRLLAALARAESLFAPAALADHYLAIFERR